MIISCLRLSDDTFRIGDILGLCGENTVLGCADSANPPPLKKSEGNVACMQIQSHIFNSFYNMEAFEK